MKSWRLEGTQGAGNGLTQMALVSRERYHAGKSCLRVARRRGPPLAPEAGRLRVAAWPVQSEHRKRSEDPQSAGLARSLAGRAPQGSSSRQADILR